MMSPRATTSIFCTCVHFLPKTCEWWISVNVPTLKFKKLINNYRQTIRTKLAALAHGQNIDCTKLDEKPVNLYWLLKLQIPLLLPGLFHRAISMSGSPISQIHLPPHQRHLAVRQAELLGCPSHTSRAILDCLRTKTSVELGNSLDSFFVSFFCLYLIFYRSALYLHLTWS